MYNHKEIEQKWQKYWEEQKTYKCSDDLSKDKFFTLIEFPYPSWAGLHIWHVKGHTATDIFARFKRMNWYNVLNWMWWDAFGLPTENYAIKNKKHPKLVTKENSDNFRKQIQSFGPSFDWDREIDTTNPDYYKWTQWIFLQLFKNGLAYEKKAPINWCPSCQTWLANEEVIDWHCERCDSDVEQKLMKQWFLAITKYADRLISDLDWLDWPEHIKTSQKNWIGRSEWTQFKMYNENKDKFIEVYTTRIDTVFGMTYAVLAPDHPQVMDFITHEQKDACLDYIQKAKNKSAMERTELNKDKTWVFTGSYVINPFNNEKVPLWIWDYVLWNYGTGAVMAVPAHDERDFEFAKKYGLEIKQIIAKQIIYTWENAPKNWVETIQRNTVDVILENDKWEVLLISDDHTWSYHFIWWWIEKWETELEAVRRELIEESWYTDFEILNLVNSSYSVWYWFRHTKQKNQRCLWWIFYAKLKSENRIESEVETKWHPVKWFKKEDVKDILTWDSHKDFWEAFINWDRCYTDDWILFHSWDFTWLTSQEAREKLTQFAIDNWFWEKKVNYKLRDWLFSRQRYWWEPMPLIHLDIEQLKQLEHITDLSQAKEPNKAYILKREPQKWESSCDATTCSWKVRELIIWQKVFSKIYDWIDGKIVCDENLPLELPEIESYEPSWNWESPLATATDWLNVRLADNLTWRRETNTMPQWAGSSWYFLRYIDPRNNEKLGDPDKLKKFMPVDIYFGGAEHTTVHLLYSRFWNKFLYDIWVVPVSEPYQRRVQHGLILAADGRKMSKRWWNVINPDDVIKEYWADAMRMYVMFMGPYGESAAWSESAINWVSKFIKKIYDLQDKILEKDSEEIIRLLHKTIKKVSQDIETVSYNTAISQMMIMLNHINSVWWITKENLKIFLKLLAPFAPFVTEEIWHNLWEKESIHISAWPEYDEKLTIDTTVNLAVQFNGKMRWTIQVAKDESQDKVVDMVKNNEKLSKYLEWKTEKKIIYVPGRIVNFIV